MKHRPLRANLNKSEHRQKKRRLLNPLSTSPNATHKEPAMFSQHSSPSSDDNPAASGLLLNTNPSQRSRPTRRLPPKNNHSLRTRFTTINHNHRVLSPIPPNTCLSRQFESCPSHLNRCCDHPIQSQSQNQIQIQNQNRAQSQNISFPHQLLSPSSSPPTRTRKRKRPTQAAATATADPDNENVPQVVVLINHSAGQSSSGPIASASSASSLDRPPESAYYLDQATKPQLLRLRRDQLLQLFRTRAAQPDEAAEHLNKDALAALIIEARTVRLGAQSSPTSVPPDSPREAEDEEAEAASSTGEGRRRPARLLTRTKSLPSQLDGHLTRSSRSRSRQRKVSSGGGGVRRRTRRTVPDMPAPCSGSSWSSGVHVDADETIGRKTVKFSGPRAGQTPIAHRTRHSATHKRPSTSPACQPMLLEGVLRSARKLRNGKVIRAKKQIEVNWRGRQEEEAAEQGSSAAEGDEEGGEPSDQGFEEADEDEESGSAEEEEDEEEENEEEAEEDAVVSGSEEEVDQVDGDTSLDVASSHDEASKGSDSEAEVHEAEDGSSEECSLQAESGLEDEEEEEEGDDDEMVDLAQATCKGLLRLKRGNLVKLCEEREIEAEGTKKDLVQSLLDWRDTNEEDGLSPSSDPCPTSPALSSSSAASEAADGRSGPSGKLGTYSQPILLQSGHEVHAEASAIQTPQSAGRRDDIGELLDLESLNLQDKEIQADQLKRLEMIGSGGFKDVYRGIYRKVPVAIADIRGHLTEMDLKELRILRDLRHENIVRFIGVSVPEDSRSVPIMIVTEICTNGDLFDYLRSIPSPGFLKICGIMRDISRGLDYLHSREPVIIHRDLKSSNVLITAKGVAKLNDFGLARIKNSTRSMVKSLVGTVNWQAPELWVAHPRYNEKVDVYSAGLVLWEMLQWHQPIKRYPFEGQNEHAIYQDVGQRHLRPATAGMRRQWGDEILNLVEKLWAQSPTDRPSMKEVLDEIEEIVESHRKYVGVGSGGGVGSGNGGNGGGGGKVRR